MSPMTKLGHCNQLREEYTVGLKEAQQAWIKWRCGKNNRTAWQEYWQSNRKSKQWAKREKSPHSSKAQPSEEASHREWRIIKQFTP